MTESKIENFTIELLKNQGFSYLFGPDISPARLEFVAKQSEETDFRIAKRRKLVAIPEKHTILSGNIY